MKDLLQQIWLPILGFFSSVGFKEISAKTGMTPENLSETAEMIAGPAADDTQTSLIMYFFIGMVGAAGGLALKILWCLLKRWFPTLKNIDK